VRRHKKRRSGCRKYKSNLNGSTMKKEPKRRGHDNGTSGGNRTYQLGVTKKRKRTKRMTSEENYRGEKEIK